MSDHDPIPNSNVQISEIRQELQGRGYWPTGSNTNIGLRALSLAAPERTGYTLLNDSPYSIGEFRGYSALPNFAWSNPFQNGIKYFTTNTAANFSTSDDSGTYTTGQLQFQCYVTKSSSGGGTVGVRVREINDNGSVLSTSAYTTLTFLGELNSLNARMQFGSMSFFADRDAGTTPENSMIIWGHSSSQTAGPSNSTGSQTIYSESGSSSITRTLNTTTGPTLTPSIITGTRYFSFNTEFRAYYPSSYENETRFQSNSTSDYIGIRFIAYDNQNNSYIVYYRLRPSTSSGIDIRVLNYDYPDYTCIPESMKVKKENGTLISAKDVKIGDMIEVEDGSFSKVTEYHGHQRKEIVKIGELEITNDHPILVDGEWLLPTQIDGAVEEDIDITAYFIGTEQKTFKCYAPDKVWTISGSYEIHEQVWDREGMYPDRHLRTGT